MSRYYGMLRARIAEVCEEQSPFDGEVEADESYFGARRVRGVWGRGAKGKRVLRGYAKNRLIKYQGVSKEEFYYYLKECEFRFNMRGEDMYKFMLKELKEKVTKLGKPQ